MARIDKSAVSARFFRLAFDLLWISFSFVVSCLITRESVPWLDYLNQKLSYLVIFGLSWWVIAVDQHVYVSRRNDSLSAVVLGVIRAVLSALFGTVFLSALLLGLRLDRSFLLTFGLVTLISAALFTLVLQPGVWNFRRRGYNLRHIIVVGSNERTTRLIQVLLAHEHYGYRVEGFLDDDPDRRALLERLGIVYLGPIKNLDQILVTQVIDGVYITLPVKSCYEIIESIAHLCEGVGVPVRLVADLFPMRLSAGDVTSMDGLPMLAVRPGELPQSAIYSRLLNTLSAAVCLVILSPILLIVAGVIWATSGRPIFTLRWRQELQGKPFRQVRFRVHRDDSASSYTAVGKFLNNYGLDKLPELFNVFLGQMSLSLPQLSSAKPPKKQPGSGSRHRLRTPRIVVGGAVIDFVGIVIAYVTALVIIEPDWTILHWSLVRNLPTLAVFLLFWASAAFDERLWSMRSGEQLGLYLTAVVRAVCNAAVFSVLATALLMPDNLEQDFLLAFCVTTLAALVVLRVVGRNLLVELRRRGFFVQRAILIGANERTRRVAERVRASGQVIDGVFDDEPERAAACLGDDLKYLGTIAEVGRFLDETRVDRVYITLPLRSHYEQVQEIIARIETRKCTGYLLGDLLPLHIARSQVTLVEDVPLLSLSPICEAYGKLAAKRLVDFVGSTALIITLLPVFLLITLLIKLDSKGHVLFAQERVGQNQRRFKILKFRSMVENAEALRPELESRNEADGPVFKIRDDPRITPVGRYLRRLSLDELPQLFNVWWGQMSLVGPRPPIPSEVELYTWNQRRRLSVKPGMTGLWQVSGRSDIPFEKWVQMDLAYIDNWSLANDIVILFKTIKAVVSRHGAA